MPQATANPVHPNFFILYVDSPLKSAAFYASLFSVKPVEESPTFALFALQNGSMFGLWSKHTVTPAAQQSFGGAEVAFAMESRAAVMEVHTQWIAQKLPIIQAPVELDFGFTFVATDPDGHRLRVFAPNSEPNV